MTLRKLFLPFFSSSLRPWTLNPYQRNASTSLLTSNLVWNSTRNSSTMADDYGQLDSGGDTFETDNFPLEYGDTLPKAQLRYSTFGTLNENRDNVLVVCHALTGNSRLDQWWGSLLGPNLPFDTSKYFVVCSNMLGSCYGSTGPTSVNPLTGRAYGIQFPTVTVRDAVRLQRKLLQEHLKIKSVACVIGGSMGGMQALELSLIGNDSPSSSAVESSISPTSIAPSSSSSSSSGTFIRSAIIIGCGARHTAWQIAISETQRQAIYADENWQNGAFAPDKPPKKGLALARKMAMISYRTAASYEAKFGRETDAKTGQFQVQSYLQYQGKKFIDRFDALTYVTLTKIMDTHDVGRHRGGIAAALRQITCPTLVLGINSDVLYPMREQEEMAAHIPHATFGVIDSINGHDGFLLEQQQVGEYICNFLHAQAKESTR